MSFASKFDPSRGSERTINNLAEVVCLSACREMLGVSKNLREIDPTSLTKEERDKRMIALQRAYKAKRKEVRGLEKKLTEAQRRANELLRWIVELGNAQ